MASSDSQEPSPAGELDFERAEFKSTAPSAVTCLACGRPIADAYYQVNGRILCTPCFGSIDLNARKSSGFGRFFKASVFGSLGALGGAIIIYLVRAITGLEAGIISLLAGYMVGSAVRQGTGHRGGRIYQFLALFLTYSALSWSYIPEIYKDLAARNVDVQPGEAAEAKPEPKADEPRPAQAESPPKDATAEAQAEAKASGEPEVKKEAVALPAVGAKVGRARTATPFEIPGLAGLLIGTLVVLVFAYVVPIYSIIAEMPGGLISLLIIFWGLQTAWKLTKRVTLDVRGPFRVSGGGPAQPEVMPHA